MQTHSDDDATTKYLEMAGGGFTSITVTPAPGRLVWGVWEGSDGCRLQQCVLEQGGGWVRVVGLTGDGQHDVEPVDAPLYWRGRVDSAAL
jgi:hypothetical protein